jgi:hypothetical protein
MGMLCNELGAAASTIQLTICCVWSRVDRDMLVAVAFGAAGRAIDGNNDLSDALSCAKSPIASQADERSPSNMLIRAKDGSTVFESVGEPTTQSA